MARTNDCLHASSLGLAVAVLLCCGEAAWPQNLTLSPTSANIQAQGGTGAVNVSTGSQALAWTAVSSPSWLSITSGASGTGNGLIQYNAQGNPSGVARNATITVTLTGSGATAIFQLTQEAGSLSLSPNTVNVSASGESNSIQTVTNNSALQWTAASNQTWLTITSGSSGNGQSAIQFTAAANPGGATRMATINVTPTGGSPVPATVTQQGGVLVVSPSSANVPGSGGAGSINLSSSGNPALQWNATSDQTWLTITAGSSGAGNGTIQWSAAANTTTSSRVGRISIAVSGVQPQVFVVNQEGGTATAMLVANPASLTFSDQIRATRSAPATVTIVVQGASTMVQVMAVASTVSGGNWLSVTGGGSTPATLTVTVTPAGLTPGTYQGAITATAANNAATPVTVPVTLTVTAAPTVSANPSQLQFAFQQGGPIPGAQSLRVTSSSAEVAYGSSPSSDAPWLMASGSGMTPGSVSVTVNPAGLSPGAHQGTVRITSGGAQNSPLLVPVTLVVTSAPNLTATPSAVSFQYRQGAAAPSPIDISITSTGSPLQISAAASKTFIHVSGVSGTTPTSIQVSVDPAGLSPGTYNGEVSVTSAGAGNSPLSIPVTLTISPAPTLTVTPQQLPFYGKVGAGILPKTVTVGASSPVDFQSTAQTSSGGNWLSVNRSSGTTPATLEVTAQAGALPAGTYNGTITITSGQAGNSPQQVIVTLTISTPPPLVVTPEEMQFSFQTGSSAPSPQTLTVTTGTGPAAPVAASATTASGGNWLSVAGGGQTPATVQVSVNPTGLRPGSYGGVVNLDAPGYQSTSVPVTLQVATSPVIGVFPGSISFGYQQNSSPPAAQTVSVLSKPDGLAFTVESTGSVLQIIVNGSGVTPGSFSISVDPAKLAPGTYATSVNVVSPEAANSPVTVPVTVTVSAAPSISAVPSSLNFSATQSGAPPPPQPLNIISSGTPLDFTSSISTGASWLKVTGSGPTPAALTVSVDASGLSPGNYQASILIQSPGAGNNPLTVPVSLTVSPAPQLQAMPSQFVFAFEISKAMPADRTLTVTSSGAALLVNATAATESGGNWLAVAGGGVTPATFTLTASPAGLSAGTYHGTISVTANGAANSPLAVPVTLIVTQAPVLNVSPEQTDFSYQIGQAAPANQQIQVTSSGGPLTFQAAAITDSGGNWVTVSAGGTTPAAVDVHVDPSGLAPGTYTGRITISSTAAGNSPVAVPLTLTVTRAVVLMSSPRALTFTYQAGSTPPAAQQVLITSGGTPIRTTTSIGNGAPWLSATGGSVTPATLAAAVNPAGLSAGSYAGLILVESDSAANSPLQIPVTLNVVQTASLSVSPAALVFTSQVSGPPAAQSLSVTSTGGALDFQSTVSPGAPWLKVSGGSATTPASIQVIADPAGLAAGNYSGSVLISSIGSTALVPVTLTISAGPTVSAVPDSLSFASHVGGPPPGRRFLLVASVGGTASVFATTMTFSGGGWLSVDAGGSTPLLLAVVVNPTGLAAGVYTGQITLTAPGAANSPLNVPVSLTVTAAAVVSAEPGSLSFAFTTGKPAPPNQQVTISSDSPVPVTLNTSTSNGVGWLIAQATGNTTPVTVTVSVNPAGLSPSIYSGSITVSSPAAGNSPLVIPVSLSVTGAPVLSASPTLVTFTYRVGDPSPTARLVLVSSTAATTVSTSVSPRTPWLSVSGGGPTPATLTLAVNVAGMAEGSYQGAVLVTAPDAANSPLSIPVTLTIQNGNTLAASPDALSFPLGGQGSASQQLTVLSSGAPLAFTATASPGSPWLTVAASGTTPQTIQVSASAVGLTAGIYQGSVLLTASGAANSPLAVPVRMEVASAPLLTTSPSAVVWSYGIGRTVGLTQLVSVTLDGKEADNFEATALAGEFPLTVHQVPGGAFTVEADPTRLAVGDYVSGVKVTNPRAGNSPLILPVHLQVTPLPITVVPNSIALASAAGSATSSVIRIEPAPAVFDVVVTGSTWLKVSATTGTAPAALTVTADPAGLRAGSYLGTVAIISQTIPRFIPVTLEVRDISALSASPKRLVFRYSSGAGSPPETALAIAGSPVPLSIQASGADSWLSVTPAATSTPGTVNVSVNPAGLAPGAYRSTVTIQAGGQAGTVAVPVELYVDLPSAPVISSVINGADYLTTPLSPGEIVSIFGSGLGPSEGAAAAAGALVNTSLGGVQVLVNGTPSPLLYVSSSQVNAIVPYALDRATAVSVAVRYQGVDSAAVALHAAPSSPACFSQTSNGIGPGSILNQDLSTNSPSNPADKGSTVAVFGTGEGQTSPPGIDGAVAFSTLLPKPLLKVSAQVNGIDAEVSYAGAAPGFAAGSFQINVKIPANVPSGSIPMQIKVGDTVSQSGLTVAVR